MTPTHPAAPEARGPVRTASRSRDNPAGPENAVLLTSELVSNALAPAAGCALTCVITWPRGQLRADAHDMSPP
jgi:hypothetical protein